MDWVLHMNAAIGYIEDHLADEIDYVEAAHIAGCSLYHFQRMFPYIMEVSLSEYIRRRRLSLAAFELQNSTVKVIDVALKYGYDSPEAFARAFQQLHGTTPTAARSAGTKLKAYPRLSFQISIKGAAAMNYRIEELGAFAVVGISEQVRNSEVFETVPRLWAEAAQAGLFEKLWEIRASEPGIRGILGVCADGGHGQNEFLNYILAIETEQEAPEAMVRRQFSPSSWVVFEVEGGPDQLGGIWKRLYTEWLPTSAYQLANLPAIECYLPPEENRNELWVAVEARA
ncbi:AraC family transcriptional regulator [Paenibacillus algorifonticola]|uniref:AraC family transcriptional regulator n=1 Tax=Paenibacillus algorifonticola TaxID=684063 RepID=UPI003D2B60C2